MLSGVWSVRWAAPLSAGACHASTVSVGRAYELLVLRVLSGHRFELRHTGRGGDRGQDMVGEWVLPGERVKVVGQCKCLRRALQPAEVREFEGVLGRMLRGVPVSVGLLASRNGSVLILDRFSTRAVETCLSSKVAMVLCTIKPLRPTPHNHQMSAAAATNHGTLHCSASDLGHHLRKHEDEEEEAVAVTTFPSQSAALSEDDCSGTGFIEEFTLNSLARRMLPRVSMVWKVTSLESLAGRRRKLLLMYDERELVTENKQHTRSCS